MILRIFTCVVLFYTTSFGQNKQYINRLLQLGKYKVNASYGYDVSKGDTVPHGAFTLKSVDTQVNTTGLTQYFSLNGAFTQQMPRGTWRFQFGEFRLDDNRELIDYQLNVKLSGVFHTALVNFREGKAHGKWTHKITQVNKSQVKETLFESSALLENGLAKGVIRLEDKNTILLGRFLRNGFAHDVWEVNFANAPDKIEQWHFKDGRLEKIVFGKESELQTIHLYKEDIPQAKTIDLDHVYLKILSLQHLNGGMSYAKIGSKIAVLLQQNSYCNQKVDNVLKGMKSISAQQISMPLFQVRVAHYPLTKQEKKQVESLKASYEKSIEVSRFLLSNTKLKILKHADDEVAFLLAVVQAIDKKYLTTIRQVVTYQTMGVLDFWQRPQMQQQLGLNTPYTPEVLVQLSDSTKTQKRAFQGANPELLKANKQGYAYLVNVAQYAQTCIDSVAKRLSKKLKNHKIQQQVEELEKVLIQKFDQFTQLSDSLVKKSPKRYREVIKAIRLATNKAIKQYSNSEEGVSVKTTQARNTITCVDDRRSLLRKISQLPNRWDTIQRIYTEQVWNPFTATIMSDQIKGRLTEAYDGLLIPSILTRIKTGLACAQVAEVHSILDQLYAKMKTLRKQNTSKLERKLRRENDPNTALELFGISTQIKFLKK